MKPEKKDFKVIKAPTEKKLPKRAHSGILVKRFEYEAEKFERIRNKILSINLDPEPLVTPVNVGAIKKHWLEEAEDHRHLNSPSFTYDTALAKSYADKKPEVDVLLNELLELMPSESKKAEFFLWSMYRTRLNCMSYVIDLAKSIISHDDITSRMTLGTIYENIPSELINLAYAHAGMNRERGNLYAYDEEKGLSIDDQRLLAGQYFLSSDIAQAIRNALEIYGKYSSAISPCPVVVTDCPRIEVSQDVISVPEMLRLNGLKLAQTVGRTVDVRWRMLLNTERYGFIGTFDQIPYNGNMKYVDANFLYGATGRDEPPVPYYIIAANLALKGNSFGQVAYALDKILPENVTNKDFISWGQSSPSRLDLIWKYTYSVFRGVHDPWNHQGYAFLKDTRDFIGYYYIKDLRNSPQKIYADYSILNRTSLNDFIKIVDIDNLEKSTIPDLKTREKTLKRALKRAKRESHQYSTDDDD